MLDDDCLLNPGCLAALGSAPSLSQLETGFAITVANTLDGHLGDPVYPDLVDRK